MSIDDLPAIPAKAMDRLLTTFKNEIVEEIHSIREDLPLLVREEVSRINRERMLRLKNRLKYLIGSVPGGLLVFLIQLFMGP